MKPMRDSICVSDRASGFLSNNRAHLRLIQAPAQVERLGKTNFGFHPPLMQSEETLGDREERDLDEADQASQETTRVPLQQQPGPIVESVGLPVDSPERTHAAAQCPSETCFRALFAHAADAIFVGTLEGTVQDVNPAACHVHGLPRECLIGQHFLDLVPPDQRTEIAQIVSKLAAGEIEHAEGYSWAADGRVIPVDIRAGRIDFAGTPALLLHVHDLTERKRIEAQLLQAQKMESMGWLAGGIAHDFNNLLTAIIGYANLAADAVAPTDPVYCDLQAIQDAAKRAAGLTRQLLAFARKQPLEPRILNLNNLICNMDTLMRRLISEDIEMVIRPAPDLTNVKADPGQIEQVLVNLIINACDAMPNGGKLMIETANVHLDAGYAHEHTDVSAGPYVLLAVTDSGMGMPPEVQAHVFEPFFTMKEPGKGTGLGLATCYGIVKQHGGSIRVRSEVGRGSSFQIYLPQVAEPHDAPRAHDQSGKVPGGTETVLLVEDAPAVRDLTARVLRMHGYTVLEARSGDEALRIAQERTGAAIDLVLTDVVLPQLNGPALAEQLAGLHPGIKVLFMSGYDDHAMVQYGQLATEVVVLPKPFVPGMLVRKVREVLEAGMPEHKSSTYGESHS